MINKVSTRFQVYEGVRISEIQHGTNGDMSSWFWISGSTNIADLLTRSASVEFIQPDTEWWNGPDFLYTPESEWNIRTYAQCAQKNVPGLKTVNTVYCTPPSIHWIPYERFSKLKNLYWMIARLLSSARAVSFKGGKLCNVEVQCFQEAKILVIKDVQSTMIDLLGGPKKSRYKSLFPSKDDQGIWIVGGLCARFNPISLENKPQILLLGALSVLLYWFRPMRLVNASMFRYTILIC